MLCDERTATIGAGLLARMENWKYEISMMIVTRWEEYVVGCLLNWKLEV